MTLADGSNKPKVWFTAAFAVIWRQRKQLATASHWYRKPACIREHRMAWDR